jgi:hypothetical protein
MKMLIFATHVIVATARPQSEAAESRLGGAAVTNSVAIQRCRRVSIILSGSSPITSFIGELGQRPKARGQRSNYYQLVNVSHPAYHDQEGYVPASMAMLARCLLAT